VRDVESFVGREGCEVFCSKRSVWSPLLEVVCGVLCWMWGAWNPPLDVRCAESSIECEISGGLCWKRGV
jgi:hypothetical protein